MANDRSQMSALKLLALSGGLSRTAKKDRAVIIRKDSQGQQHEVAVDLKKVLERTSEDVRLQASDILYVPDSASKQAMYRALEFGIALEPEWHSTELRIARKWLKKTNSCRVKMVRMAPST